MESIETLEIYLKIKEQVDSLINDMSDIDANIFITNTYMELYKQDPAFIWFSLGTIVSSQVGSGIYTSSSMTSLNIPVAVTLENALPNGNQIIFKDIVPLYLTYLEVGVPSLIKLLESGLISLDKSLTLDQIIISSFQNLDKVHQLQIEIAENLNLPINSPVVEAALFQDKDILKIISEAAQSVAAHEQSIIQAMYDDDFTAVMIKLMSMPEFLHLTGVTINGTYFPMSQFIDNPADLDQRVQYANALIDEVASMLSEEGGFQAFNSNLNIKVHMNTNLANIHYLTRIPGETTPAEIMKMAEFENELKESIREMFIKDDFWESIEAQLQAQTVGEPLETPISSELPDSIDFASLEPPLEPIRIDTLTEQQLLDIFLLENPNFSLAAHSAEELLNAHYFRSYHFPEGSPDLYHFNSALPFLGEDDSLLLSKEGILMYHPRHGEMREIPFPMLYNNETGAILTIPISEQDNSLTLSTIDIIYHQPELFTQVGELRFNNDYHYGMIDLQSQLSFTTTHFNIPNPNNLVQSMIGLPESNIIESGFSTDINPHTYALINGDNAGGGSHVGYNGMEGQYSGDGSCMLHMQSHGPAFYDCADGIVYL